MNLDKPMSALLGVAQRLDCACCGSARYISVPVKLRSNSKRGATNFQSGNLCDSASGVRQRRGDRQRGGWVSGAVKLTEPGHVPAAPAHNPSWHFESHLCCLGKKEWLNRFLHFGDRRRGGLIFLPRGHTDPSHVPTEPSQLLATARSDFSCNREVAGFLESWYPGYVPTEPSQICTWVRCDVDAGLDVGLQRQYGVAVPFFVDSTFDYSDSGFVSCKLTISVRQPAWLSEPCKLGKSLLLYNEQVVDFSGDILWTLHGSLRQWFVVVSACLCGGLLSTLGDALLIQSVDGHLAAFGASQVGRRFCLVFFKSPAPCAVSWRLLLEFFENSDAYASFFGSIREDGPMGPCNWLDPIGSFNGKFCCWLCPYSPIFFRQRH